MMSIMKITFLQLLLVSLCVMVQHATSLPKASVTVPQAIELPSHEAVAAESGVNEVYKDETSALALGDKVAAAAAQLMSVAEAPPRNTECGKVGDFCNLADDCCTKRCLNYARRCVN